ncbi:MULTISPECIES: phosphatase PAP2 family protein [unclassified Mesorhizobium]|uniref:phosphatase PAP2 family protein n=1 Tax=unclassified Mesorhizobium TaxID=325217 RepID=UPI0015E28245|nr:MULTISPECIES: phosphatase PAP2 family protein [unclassified Mesorhizobium]
MAMQEGLAAKADLRLLRDRRAANRTAVWLGMFVGTYSLLAGILFPELYLENFKAFLLDFLPTALLICFIGLLGTGILRRPASPLSYLAEIMAARGLGAIAVAFGTTVGVAAFWTFKYHIPDIVPFYADPLLANLDATLHFGDPWRLLHAIIPAGAMPMLVIIYFPVWLFLYFAAITSAALCSEPLRTRYMFAFAVTTIGLGTVMAALLASVGPIFYDAFFGGDRFADLRAALGQSDAARPVLAIADRLYSAHMHGAKDVFVGISAMPSIHVAMATLNALFFSQLNRRLGYIAWGFAALTLLCSVYFGWHYAVDGYVSILAVALIWRITGHLCGGGDNV